MSGAQIPAVMTGVTRRPTSSLAAGTGGRLWLDVTPPRGTDVPRALVHRLSVSASPSAGAALTFDGTRTRVRRRPTPVLSPPLGGGDDLNFNECCGLSLHRVTLVPVDGTPFLSERFAADFIQIDCQGREGAGDLGRNENFFTFGEPVLAVGDARVVSRRDGLDENTPLVEPQGFTPETTLGNNVVLRLADGRHALYAHLQKGERARAPQPIRAPRPQLGKVGNTGQSGGPYLHFQLSDGPDAVASDGLPFAFERFTLIGTVSNVERVLTGTAPADVRAEPAGTRRRQHPL